MHELYHEFEKYCKSDNDFRKRLEEQNSTRRRRTLAKMSAAHRERLVGR